MGTISSGIGLITGMNITDTVDKLMAIATQPHDRLKTQTTNLQTQQTAFTGLSALLYSLKYVTDNLGKADLYSKTAATSSNAAALTATVMASPAKGVYQFTPLQMASTQQWLGSGVRSSSEALGGGTLTLRYGDTVTRDNRLDVLGGGAGISRGTIRITDRSGVSSLVDLSSAQTLDDVLNAINQNTSINVTASITGDKIRLTDNTGQTLSNLKVQEVGGTTAASLGLSGINVAASTADGTSLARLYDDLQLDALGDGRGVRTDSVLSDIQYQLRDGTTGTIDLSPILPNSSTVDRELTLGEMLDRINAAAPNKLKVEIDADGQRLKITDLTTGSGQFQLSSLNDSQALADLGLDGTAAGGVITGRRILSGTKTVLLSSLGGGRGLGSLGQLQLTDRSGASATVDLSGAETLSQVIDAINAAGIGIQAQVNRAGNGIELIDTTGSTANNMVVASGDSTGTAEKLHLAVDSAAGSVNSGDLHLQVVSQSTTLDSLRGGAGVARGTLVIRDSSGATSTLNLQDKSIQTVGDVIAAIRRLSVKVDAEINATGDGIRLIDQASGSGQLTVTEGSSTTASDLGLLRSAKTETIDGQSTQVIDGSMTETIQLAAGDTLDDLRTKINALGIGASATIVTDGSTRPYRLVLASGQSGGAGNLVIDASGMPIGFEETVHGQDARLLYGTGGNSATGMTVSSSTNVFKNAIDGVNLEIKQPSSTPVTVSITTDSTNFVASVKTMVDNYNKFRDQLKQLTAYDAAQDKRAALTGDIAALRMDSDFADLLSSRFSGASGIHSLAAVGITLDDDGKLSFDQGVLQNAYADNPQGVQSFFADKDTGLSAKFAKLIEQIAGPDNSLLSNRTEALQSTIDENQTRLDRMQALLDSQRERLLMQFYNMEIAIGKLKDNISVIDSLQPITQLWAANSDN